MMQKNPKRPDINVALYARSATDKKGGSVDKQIARLTSLVEDRRRRGENWIAKEKLVDGQKSAHTTDRPAYRKLLKLVRSGKINIVAVTKVDRISRSLSDFVKLAATLDHHGVKFVSLTEEIDVTAPMGLVARIGSFRRTAEKRRLC